MLEMLNVSKFLENSAGRKGNRSGQSPSTGRAPDAKQHGAHLREGTNNREQK